MWNSGMPRAFTSMGTPPDNTCFVVFNHRVWSHNATLSHCGRSIMIIVIVQVHVNADAVTAFEAATEDNAANSRLEPGVVRFDVLRQQQDPARFALVEVYRDESAVAAHKTTAHYLRWRDAVADLMAEPRVGVAYSNVSPSDSEW
jgi:(4S)-4-hydroxy-5-phosphonooxypentane-2,3-dione isomerase